MDGVKRPDPPSGPGEPDRPRRDAGRGRRWVPPRSGRVPPDTGAGPDPQPRPQPPRRRYPWDEQDTTPSAAARSRPQAAGPPTTPLRGRSEPKRGRSEPGRARPAPEGDRTEPAAAGPADPQPPTKITVTRVVAWRSRQLAGKAVALFRRATTADGAGRSGLSSLTYATMMNYAADAAIAIALANTLFFAAATAESRSNVALYLLITVAPFAVIAPVIGPLLDRLGQGRRLAMAISFGGRGLLLVVIAMHLDDWLLYPAALGFMVLSKSFHVLKAAVTPRVLPPEITLVKTNSRITVFGLAAGGVVGAMAAGLAALLGSSAALWFDVAVCLAGVLLCLRIPSWVERTEGEMPASLRAERTEELATARRRQPMGQRVVVALWGNACTRLLTGFLTLFVAFVVKAQTEGSPVEQVLLLGMFGAAGGAGSFLGNAIGARMHFGKPDQVILGCISAGLTMAALVALVPGITVATVTALVAGTGSALAKVCLDAVIQRDMPEASRNSAFGRSETVLQLAWVFGGALGILLPATYWIGFGTLSVVLGLGMLQTTLARRGSSLLPRLGGNRPLRPDPPTVRHGGYGQHPPTREFSTVRDLSAPEQRPRS
ncbi:MAG: MFS transporter [Pseudonocardiaceae bacterium]|nr:MFS transporter [Pseudonocardiaceae bacterium]